MILLYHIYALLSIGIFHFAENFLKFVTFVQKKFFSLSFFVHCDDFFIILFRGILHKKVVVFLCIVTIFIFFDFLKICMFTQSFSIIFVHFDKFNNLMH